MSNDEDNEYSDEDIIEYEAIFGEGFLSPGGHEEVAKIVENVNLAGKDVLDIGVGIGGPACLLVEKHGAARVTGIDVEDTVLKKAAQTVLCRGLQDRVLLRRVDPGPLPFDDESFDVVFSKDAIIHIHDKGALFREIYRVLRPGGCIAMSDWYCSEKPLTEEMAAWLEPHGSEFVMTPIQNDANLLGLAGFVDTVILDRTAWFAKFSRELVDHMRGPGYDTLVKTVGKDIAEKLTSNAEKRKLISAQGQLRPGHLRGHKPVWEYQVRIYLGCEVAEVARRNPDNPAIKPLANILSKNNAIMRCQFDAFAAYVAEAEKCGTVNYPLYEWTKATIEDPAKKAKYLKSFTLYVDGDEVYAKEKADALERDLKPLIGGLLTRMSRHDTNPANNPQPPARYRK